MPEMKVENWNGHNIRFVWKDGDWWGVAKDVAEALDYDTVAHMIRMVDKPQKGVQKVDTLGGAQNLAIVSELGIYDCVFGSHKKEAMRRLQDVLRHPRKVDYIKANTIADKAVSNRYGHPKMVKKGDMSPAMLAEREAILDDTVQLMALNDKYGMGISVSQTIYQVKGTNHYENH